MAAAAFLKNRKIVGRSFSYFNEIWQVTQFDPRDRVVHYKFKIYKIQDGGGRHPEKSENYDISATV